MSVYLVPINIKLDDASHWGRKVEECASIHDAHVHVVEATFLLFWGNRGQINPSTLRYLGLRTQDSTLSTIIVCDKPSLSV